MMVEWWKSQQNALVVMYFANEKEQCSISSIGRNRHPRIMLTTCLSRQVLRGDGTRLLSRFSRRFLVHYRGIAAYYVPCNSAAATPIPPLPLPLLPPKVAGQIPPINLPADNDPFASVCALHRVIAYQTAQTA